MVSLTDLIAVLNLCCTIAITTIAIIAFRQRGDNNDNHDEHRKRKP